MLKDETLDRWIAAINRRTNRPPAPWQRQGEGEPFKALIGNLHRDENSPGDRHGTRYHLAEMVSEGGGISHVATSQSFNRREFECFVQGLLYGTELAGDMFAPILAQSREDETIDTGEVLRLLDTLRDGR